MLYADAGFSVTVDPNLNEDEEGTILEGSDGNVRATITAALAEKLTLHQSEQWSAAAFRQGVADAGARFHGGDYLFYFQSAEMAEVSRQMNFGTVRRLTLNDVALFSDFCSEASEDDLDAAYVELHHWAVFGSFEQSKLVCAASMYPWKESKIADLGVLTLSTFRGRGHARNTLRAISKFAHAQGHQPQYRCQLDNQGSILAARAAGLSLFGTWDVLLAETNLTDA